MDEQMLEVAKKAAREAGKRLLEGFGQSQDYSYKEDFSQSTQADKDAEKIIIDTIKETFPDHAIMAEESGEQGDSEFLWIIDPLDGTSNYVRGIPIFGVAIALTVKGDLTLGVNYLPAKDELYWAEKGKGAFLNDQKIQVSKKDNVREGVTFFETGRDEASRIKYGDLMRSVFPKIGSLKKFGSSVYELCLLAKGDAEVMVELNSNFWDVASGIIIVEEAGGKVTKFSGEVDRQSRELLITNGAIHANFLKLLNS